MTEASATRGPAPGHTASGLASQPSGGPKTLDEKDDVTVRNYARALVGQAGFTASDVDDIEQELRLELLTYLHRFDRSKGKRRTFINCLIKRKCADLLRRRFTEMRVFNGQMRSLEEQVDTDDGPAALLDTVTRADQERRLNAPPPPPLADLGLEIDVREAVTQMPADLRKLYEEVKAKSRRQIAAERGLSRRTIRRRVAKLRKWLEDWAIRNSLRIVVPLSASQTKERNRGL